MAYHLLVTWLCFAVLSLIGISLQQKSDLRLEVEPRYIQVTRGTPVTLTCTLSDGAGGRVPLAGCGFRDRGSGAAWDIGTGSAIINNTIKGEEINALITSNTGESGMCNLKIAGLTGGTYILGCRVRPVTGDWRYAAMMVYVDNWLPLQYRLQPPGVLVSLPGSDVIITGLAEHEVDVCRFYFPPYNTEIYLNSWRTSENTTEYRVWTEDRRCGVTLLSVKPEESGFVWSTVSSSSSLSASADFVELLVSMPPVSPPLLSVNITGAPFQAGDMLHATCLVGESRPVSNITWLLGGEVVRNDNWNEAPAESTWRWNYEPQKIIQRLSRRLRQQDDGKELKCRAEHLALPTGLLDSNTRIIHVGLPTDPCSPNPCGPHSVCHVTGKYIRCSCLPRHTGSDPHCRPECVGNADCPEGKACVESVCEDVCPGDCGMNALCRVISHASLCECPEGLYGDPHKRCEEEPCGVRNSNPILISGGHEAKREEFPWHASIFEARSDGRHIARCGGTLIKTNIVITAAHCLYDANYRRPHNVSTVKVVLGKHFREWVVEPKDTDEQHFDADQLIIPEDYLGKSDDYRLDIAIIKLATSAVLTTQVKIACIDWTNSFYNSQLRNGSNGTVAGWGLTFNSSIPANTLQWMDLPWVNKVQCRSGTPTQSRRYITRDKFCAGYLDQEISVCVGDSGGGLLFFNETNNRYYLRGVVSTSLAYNVKPSICSPNHYTTFTSLVEHTDWIKERLLELL